MSTLAVKLLLAPLFAVAASLAVRRLGPLLGGVVGGLPVVAGPILLTFALEHGAAFAARATVATLLGLISLTAFVVVYGWLTARANWVACLGAGWLAFLAMTAALEPVHVRAGVALLLAWGTFAVVLRLTARSWAADPGTPATAPPRWDLPLRAVCALALVLALTGAAAALGPHLSGLLAPFPIVTSVLAAFTHAQAGPTAARRLLRGLVLGYFAFALFCVVAAVLVEPLGIGEAFAIATAGALLCQGALLALRVGRAGVAVPAAAAE